jgi:hypothetical protein
MNFEDDGSGFAGGCKDTNAAYDDLDCDGGGYDTASTDPKISGCCSGYTDGGVGNENASSLVLTPVTNAYMDIRYEHKDDQGTDSVWPQIGFLDEDSDTICGLALKPSTLDSYMYLDGTSWTLDKILTTDTVYQIRVQILNNDGSTYDCRLTIDVDSGTNYGSGDEAVRVIEDINHVDSGNDIDGWFHWATGGGDIDAVIDDIGICSGTPTEGVKCGS